MHELVTLVMTAVAGLLWTAGAAGLLPRAGTRWGERLARAPGLDAAVSGLTWVPWVLAGGVGGWAGLVGVVLGQAAGLLAWVRWHEWRWREELGEARIVRFINGRIGRVRNHLALWFTLVALPVFLLIRAAQVLVWPVVRRLCEFPPYEPAEWIRVSRQKFGGLVGHDLVWCLYCDWMTGVYALGAEMLRNVESFWCPIRFDSDAKCENCRLDFPDVSGGEQGWVDADADMTAVVERMETMYANDKPNAWFGHPVRLTVEGEGEAMIRKAGKQEKQGNK